MNTLRLQWEIHKHFREWILLAESTDKARTSLLFWKSAHSLIVRMQLQALQRRSHAQEVTPKFRSKENAYMRVMIAVAGSNFASLLHSVGLTPRTIKTVEKVIPTIVQSCVNLV